ncbi:unnamed protein product [Adineta steineri]|uniref:Uncharacterized protein n=1 Tax=Adineta steineri TaxID=433720 RepID=A0A818NV15_9BILA|nr:unnamed protein product [Adineta steineri]CAF3609772.1 unnamed protein product [Adineta steineri]
MASSTLAIPIPYHKPTPTIRKSKLDTTKNRSEDELLKFFLHGSYDVQRGNIHAAQQIEPNHDKTICIKEETTTTIPNLINDDIQGRSRCMFEETYMINISVKQPDTAPLSKQIDVRIEKTPSEALATNEKIDVDEISSIFDEDDNDDVDSVIFNELTSSRSETPSTKLTLADMISKSLTTIPTRTVDNGNKNKNWYVEKQDENKIRKASGGDIPGTKIVEKVIKTPPPGLMSSIIRPAALITNINEDKKLFEYLDYLDTKEESKQPTKSSNIITTTKTSKSVSPVSKNPSKQQQQQQQQHQQQQHQQQQQQQQHQQKHHHHHHHHEPIPIIDLEQLCRSLHVNDLKDELIRKKIYELKVLIDERHKRQKHQMPLIAPRKDTLPVLIAMPPAVQQRRKTTVVQPSALLKSETIDLQVPYESTYHDIISNYNNKHSSSPPSNKQQYTRQQVPAIISNRKYQHT